MSDLAKSYVPMPDSEVMDMVQRWIEHDDDVDPTLLTEPFTPPLYAQETVTERIEPYATEYDELSRQHPDYWRCLEGASQPDPEFYQPTPKLLALEARLAHLRRQGFRTVPNPHYDAARAAAWYKHATPPTSFTIGQSYHPRITLP